MTTILAPSVLSADFGNLSNDVEMLNASQADWFHVDIMDGVFVPNISFGFPVMKVLKAQAKKLLDVHLMIVNPEKYIERFAEAGAGIITVHAEACPHLHRAIQQIKATGAKAGVALNPHTPVNILENVLGDIDLALVMSVNPGFGGQKFIPAAVKKVSDLRKMAAAENPELLIEVDGGVNLDNCQTLLSAGANALVAGNAVFGTSSPMDTIATFKAKMATA